MQVFSRIIDTLESIQDILPYLEKLGRDHSPFKIKKAHFTVFEQAILKTLEDKLGDDFD